VGRAGRGHHALHFGGKPYLPFGREEYEKQIIEDEKMHFIIFFLLSFFKILILYDISSFK